MDCEKAQILMIPHITDDLEPGEGHYRQVETHLSSCHSCAEQYSRITSAWEGEAPDFETILQKLTKIQGKRRKFAFFYQQITEQVRHNIRG